MKRDKALKIAMDYLNQELDWVKEEERTPLHLQVELALNELDAMVKEFQETEYETWNELEEYLDGCGDDALAHAIKFKMRNDVAKGDTIELGRILDEDEQEFLEKNLTNHLSELDMDCERERAMVVSSLISEVTN